MAKRKPGPHMIIANRLTDGRAVFMTAAGAWTADPLEAAKAEGEAIDALEAAAIAAKVDNIIVDPEVVPATEDGRPAHIKQQMQVTGPSVRRDLGYQSGNI